MNASKYTFMLSPDAVLVLAGGCRGMMRNLSAQLQGDGSYTTDVYVVGADGTSGLHDHPRLIRELELIQTELLQGLREHPNGFAWCFNEPTAHLLKLVLITGQDPFKRAAAAGDTLAALGLPIVKSLLDQLPFNDHQHQNGIVSWGPVNVDAKVQQRAPATNQGSVNVDDKTQHDSVSRTPKEWFGLIVWCTIAFALFCWIAWNFLVQS